MFILVSGGSGSGKSEYAERLLSQQTGLQGERYYIATMRPFGEEGRKRVRRHRQQRQGRHFHTIECYRGLGRLELPGGCDVLLECISNLLANEMFDEIPDSGEGCAEDGVIDNVRPDRAADGQICKKILLGVEHLREQCRHVVVVTNDVFADGISYDDSTRQYIAALGQINRQLAQMADVVVEVVYSIPVCHKGRQLLLHVDRKE